MSECKYKSFHEKKTSFGLQDLHLNILAPKQMLQRLPIVLAQVQAGNTAKNLLNEICQIICSLYRGKERNYEKSL